MRVVSLAAMAAREHGIAHDVEQKEKTIPFFTSETVFHQHVGEFCFGVKQI